MDVIGRAGEGREQERKGRGAGGGTDLDRFARMRARMHACTHAHMHLTPPAPHASRLPPHAPHCVQLVEGLTWESKMDIQKACLVLAAIHKAAKAQMLQMVRLGTPSFFFPPGRTIHPSTHPPTHVAPPARPPHSPPAPAPSPRRSQAVSSCLSWGSGTPPSSCAACRGGA
jgi:hypothetical protein